MGQLTKDTSPFIGMLIALVGVVAALSPLGFHPKSWEIVVVLSLIAGGSICAIWGYEAMSQAQRISTKDKAVSWSGLYSDQGKPLQSVSTATDREGVSAVPLIPIVIGFLLTLALIYAVVVFSN